MRSRSWSMNNRRRTDLLLALLLTATVRLGWERIGTGQVVQAQNGFWLRDGDRVLFYGDSITERGLYPTLVEEYVLTRFPRWQVSFLSRGWSGDRVSGGAGGSIDQRLARDVIAARPTVVTTMLGMNDGGYCRYRS